jgi:outer membrane lipoprotein LolB
VRPAACALLAATLLTACATVRPPEQPGAAPWISGRISVRIEASAERAAQGVSAAFELRGDGDSGELRLTSPLGVQLAQARWAPGVALLDTPQGEQRYATLDDLSQQALGDVLPLAALPAWLSGRPWSGASHVIAESGFEQLGWQVLLTGRTSGLIEARRAAPPQVTIRVRLDNLQP